MFELSRFFYLARKNKRFFLPLLILRARRELNILDIHTDLTIRERLFLFSQTYKNRHNIKVIVEIGSYLGASACFLASGSAKGSKVYCVDTWTNLAMSEGPKDTYEDFMQNTKTLKDKIVPLKGFSKEIAQQFHEEIDMLFIDGDHSYEGVKNDLYAWLPHTKEATILVMHDYGWAEGVIQVVGEIIKPIEIKKGMPFENMYITQINRKGYK
jgi:predicted O-methyltransferase YrrM